MAWTNLSFSYGSILTSAKMTNLYDNLTALANGDSGAPQVQMQSLSDAQAGDWINGPISYYGTTTITTSPTKMVEVFLPRGGTWRTRIKATCSAGPAYYRVYRNGVAVGATRGPASLSVYQEDIAGWTAGDLIQLYVWLPSGSAVSGEGWLQIQSSDAFDVGMSPNTPNGDATAEF